MVCKECGAYNAENLSVCKECGAVLPFHDDDLEAAIDRLSARLDFTVTEHDIVLRGLCASCS